MKASTVLLYESRNTFLGACHVLSKEEWVTKPSRTSFKVAVNSHGQLSKLLISKVISVVSVKHSLRKFSRSINVHNNETCSRNKSFSLDVIIFLDHVMLPLRTVSFSFPTNHVHMSIAPMNKQKANFLVNIKWLELGN